MNPYTRLTTEIPWQVYPYTQGILGGPPWPELAPTANVAPLLEAEISESRLLGDQMTAVCQVTLSINGKAQEIFPGIKWWTLTRGLISAVSGKKGNNAGFPLQQILLAAGEVMVGLAAGEVMVGPIKLPAGARPFAEEIFMKINESYREWNPPEPPEELLIDLLLVSPVTIPPHRRAAEVTIIKFQPNPVLNPIKDINIGYALFKDRPIFAISGHKSLCYNAAEAVELAQLTWANSREYSVIKNKKEFPITTYKEEVLADLNKKVADIMNFYSFFYSFLYQ